MVACPLDGGIATVLLGAGILLLSRSRWAALFQRAAFWALLLRCGVVVMGLSLPSEGGGGGFLILIGLPVLALLALTALHGAVAVKPFRQGAGGQELKPAGGFPIPSPPNCPPSLA